MDVEPGGHVERCAECNGAFAIVAGSQTEPVSVREAARRRRYLAEHVMKIAEVPRDQIGHRAYCSEKGRAS